MAPTIVTLARELGSGVIRRAQRANDPEERELARLIKLPRYTNATTTLLKYPITINDVPSFVPAYRSIWQRQLYDLELDSTAAPRILDCGAHVGLATIYWKSKYPMARITSFEADPSVFALLDANCRSFGFADCERVNAAVWIEEGTAPFWTEGGDSGRLIIDEPPHPNNVTVSTVRLKRFLSEPIDLLKLDIEGSEVDVLLDCADALHMVHRIFVEYHSHVGRRQRLDEVLAALRGAGFRVYAESDPALVARRPFVGVDPHYGMDNQVNLFGFRSAAG